MLHRVRGPSVLCDASRLKIHFSTVLVERNILQNSPEADRPPQDRLLGLHTSRQQAPVRKCTACRWAAAAGSARAVQCRADLRPALHGFPALAADPASLKSNAC